MGAISIFGFRALWSPFFLLTILFITVLYFLITTVWRKHFKNSEPLKVKQATYFILSMVLLYAVKGSPIDLMGHIMFSMHMIQMSFLVMIIAPLFILGIPNWLWLSILGLPVVKQIFRFFTKPVISVILFNVFFSLYHLPFVFDTIKKSEIEHGLYTLFLFILAVFLWWPMINKVPGQNQLSGVKKVAYLITSAILLTPACGIIIFAGHPIYQTYSDSTSWLQAMSLCVPMDTLANLNLSGPELFSPLPVLEDQQLGGVIMKIVQEIADIVILGKILFEWFRKDQEEAEKFTEMMLANKPEPVK
ncbi:cytochrome C oxidase assembly protein [Heyndrickxia shackletonii]|uniref:Cytochrome C oxidase assembly protein n=1 Tax=Heyndrickxia shackletonii TaxID=157838 RepID=A0A0Q3WZH4_9BACI|nr:cytochrome c oxidase assembly factor CtaG [Heyndrickxia shackletonii]KQL54754.1 cytochrome C oxidase assembly protein [Heyndrickxia shackletonii]MBB2480390.1 cytochrome c oxidase assembly factor CtaG [Bacillus sp. APMAM]NEY98410.1 cytochrome c oxidase assembly factor CtaG [Heyndrickxia shackletonii]RTZ57502.1 cytochrome c oxidase assembly factor CtaG [Bacillus sp. SAJ1]